MISYPGSVPHSPQARSFSHGQPVFFTCFIKLAEYFATIFLKLMKQSYVKLMEKGTCHYIERTNY